MVRRKQRRNTALLILDMVSEFEFPNARPILRQARSCAVAISRLKARARAAGIPVIYVNDTAERWESDQEAFVRRCLAPSAKGRHVVRIIRPEARDYFIFKPKHSAFFDTPLPTLLAQLRIKRLVLTGSTSHQCVLFTATDAYVRDFELVVPPDCIAAATHAETRHALFIFEHALRASTALSSRIRL